MVVRDRFFFKNFPRGKNDQNGQKRPKNSVFKLLKKISSLVLSEKDVK